MDATDTRLAIDAADRALEGWKRKTAKVRTSQSSPAPQKALNLCCSVALRSQERGDILRKWYDLLMANIGDLAKILTLENGKPLAESRGEIGYAAR